MRRIGWMGLALWLAVLTACAAPKALASEGETLTLQQRYDAALTARDEAKQALDAAQEAFEKSKGDYAKGAPGFYRWIAEKATESGQTWMAEDAEKALALYESSSFKSHTKAGEEEDASDLENMKNSLDLFAVLSEVRSSDEYHKELPPVYTNSLILARAQVNANGSAVTRTHMRADAGYPGADYTENLALNQPVRDLTRSNSAFSEWYDKGKKEYKNLCEYVKDRFPDGLSYGTDAFENYVSAHVGNKLVTDYVKYRNGKGSILIYYENIFAGKLYTYSAGTVQTSYADALTAGFGLHSGKNSCCVMEINAINAGTGRYTVSEYRDLFMTYYNQVTPVEEKEALEAARKAYDEAERAFSTVEKEWKKENKIKNTTVTLKKSTYTYTGKKIKPTVRVRRDGKTVKKKYYSVSYKRSSRIGTATVTVKGKGSYTGLLRTLEYTINPPRGKLRSATWSSGRLKIKWKKVSAASGYELQIARDKAFSDPIHITVDRASKTSYRKSGLEEGTTYYVRMRVIGLSQGERLEGRWSKILTVQ